MRGRSNLAAVALVSILFGAATATAAGLVDGGDIRNGSLSGADFRNKSLPRSDFRGSSRGPTGGIGPAGPAGAPGPPATPTLARITRVEEHLPVAPGTVGIATVECPDGQGIIGGGFSVPPPNRLTAQGTVFFSDSLGSPTSWSVGLQFLNAGMFGSEVYAAAYCVPQGQPFHPLPVARSK